MGLCFVRESVSIVTFYRSSWLILRKRCWLWDAVRYRRHPALIDEHVAITRDGMEDQMTGRKEANQQSKR
jgi:hypothetical protein